jgi:hypothetical protein
MPIDQRESRGRVIENRLLPAGLVMAGLAVLFERSAVGIGVTRRTAAGSGRDLHRRLDMTLRAFHRGVAAEQRERGPRMVDPGRAPRLRVMAGGARGHRPRLVRVGMAIRARSKLDAFVCPRVDMTRGARHARMRTSQWKRRAAVIEPEPAFSELDRRRMTRLASRPECALV